MIHSGTSGLGENLFAEYMSGGGSFVPMSVGVQDWINEGYTPGSYNHYTQVVWSTTTNVGCGYVEGSGCKVLVCQYTPQGNFIGQAPF